VRPGAPLGVVPARFAGQAVQPMAGAFEGAGDAVRFVPRFPFVDGEVYALLSDGVVVGTIARPLPASEATTVVAGIHPSGEEVPLNLLRIYVHFSAPMSEGWAARSVQMLRGDTGEVLKGTFLHMEPELWDRAHRRLTVFLDPGRIKRGLVPQQEAGYPLVEGQSVELRVDAGFRDAAGRPLRSGAMQRYRVGDAARVRVQPGRWELRPPAAGSTEPLVVELDRPLDHALLGRCLWVEDTAGLRVDGQAWVGEGERSWRFAPAQPWVDAPMQLVVDTALEDVAGNSAARVFDRDLGSRADDPLDVRQLRYPFACPARRDDF
jgi:hypothetical protein